MSPAELIIRVLLAVLLPPLSVIGLKGVGLGTIILMIILTCFAWVPGQIAAFFLLFRDYNSK
ncbi:MAG: YqaE/Pmp3 family membrane protein [Lentisphaeria bacterium]|nr:YqaE/Pmp3 family membrane protein [Lentisphaeria bacterium]